MAAKAVTTAAADDRSEPSALPINKELEELWRSGLEAVRRRWRHLLGHPMPRGLGRAMTLRILAYYAQVEQYGGLDQASRRTLAACLAREPQTEVSASPVEEGLVRSRQSKKIARAPDLLRPGTLLSREHAGILHNVMVLDKGFAWSGRTFDSLSKVAFAITGTRWNGPRFFGLRDDTAGATRRKKVEVDGVRLVTGRGRVAANRRVRYQGASP